MRPEGLLNSRSMSKFEPDHRNPTGLFSDGVRRLTLAQALVTGIVAFEGLSVVAALPELGRDLTNPETVSFLPWVITAYLLSSGIAIAATGPLADSIGPRAVFRVGLVIFGAASLACGWSSDLASMVPLRLIQGASGGMLIAGTGAAIGLGYPLRLRSRAYAMASTVWGGVGFGGPALAAALLSVLSWRWIFWVNVPFVVLALAAAWTTIPGPVEGASRGIADWHGIGLLSAFTITASIGLSAWSWLCALSLAAALLSAWIYHRRAGSAGVVVLQRRHYSTMPFRALALSAALVMTAGVGVENFLPLYLREARGTSTAVAAWSVVFLTIGWTSASNIASRLYERIREERVALIGAALLPPALLTSGLAVALGGSLGWIYLAFFILGLGIGATTNAALTLVQHAAVPGEIGRATAAHLFLRSLAVTYGTALFGAVVLAGNPTLGSAPVLVSDARAASHGVASLFGASTEATLGRGFLLAHGLAILVALGGVLAAVNLVRHSQRSRDSVEIQTDVEGDDTVSQCAH